MARTAKKFTPPQDNNLIIPIKNTPPTSEKQIIGKSVFVENKRIPPVNPGEYAKVAYGIEQKLNQAPLEVPNGFTTQIPYENGLNSTIITNPSPIPITTMKQVFETDEVVHSSMLHLITTILSTIKRYKVPNHPEAEWLCNKSLEVMGKQKILNHYATAFIYGFTTASVRPATISGYTMFTEFNAIPQHSIIMSVTPEGYLDKNYGVMQYYYNLSSAYYQNPQGYSNEGNAPFAAYGSYFVPQRQTIFNSIYVSAIPEEFRCHWAFNPGGMAGNYWGTSLIPCIFKDVCNKNEALYKVAIAMTYKASPFTIFQTDSNTTVQVAGQQTTQSLAENLAQSIPVSSQQGYTIIDTINGFKTTVLDNTADIEKMMIPVNYANEQIRTGLLSPNLTGNSGSYANAMANNSSHMTTIHNFRDQLVEAIRQDLCIRNIKMGIDIDNQPDDYGYFEIIDNDVNNQLLYQQMITMARENGLFNPLNLDDYNFGRNKAGLQPVNEITSSDEEAIMMAINGGMPSSPNSVKDTKSKAGQPYAQGMKEVQNDHYK